MAYTISIAYAGLTQPVDERCFWEIPRTWGPKRSYIDTKPYEGTVYDTNIDGWGFIEMPEPYASTSLPFPVPLAQFKLATMGGVVTFETDDYKEAFYYAEVGAAVADQGFEIVVTAADGSQLYPVPPDPDLPPDPGPNP